MIQTKLSRENVFLILASQKHSQELGEELKIHLQQKMDWKKIVNVATFNGVAPLLFMNLKRSKLENLVPPKAILSLRNSYFQTLMLNSRRINNLQEILKLFAEKNMQVIGLKGVILVQLVYKDLGLRPMSDIDLLVEEADLQRAEKIMNRLGYRTHVSGIKRFFLNFLTRKHQLPIFSNIQNNTFIEIHSDINPPINQYKADLQLFKDKSIFLKNSLLKTFSPEDLLIHLCLHLDRHFFIHGKFRLAWISDILELLRKFQTKFQWKLFMQSCENQQIEQPIYQILNLVNRLYAYQFPTEIAEKIVFFHSSELEDEFVNYLNRQQSEKQILKEKKIRAALGRISGRKAKIKFLLSYLFPSVSFLKQKYSIRHVGIAFLFYPIRLLSVIYKIIRGH